MRHLTLVGGVSAAALVFATNAEAQTAAPAGSTNVIEQVVVTGSRIVRRDFVSATPIVTANEELIHQSGISNVEESLNVLPMFVPAGDATNTGRGLAGQRATLNLRGLGTNRNLVLLDGRRLPFSSATGVIDVNILPSAIIQSVETITGGASAVYGSDAMSGVVNFITRRSFTGLQVDARMSDTDEMDRQTREVSRSVGGDFADNRGNAVVSVGYSDRENLHSSRRAYRARTTLSGFLGTGTYVATPGNLPDQDVLNAVFTSYDGQTTNVPRSGGTANIGFNDDGTLFLLNGARNYRGPTSGAYVIHNGLVRHPFGATLDITSGQERRWLYGNVSYELAPSLELYAQLFHVDTETDQDDGMTLTQYGELNTIPATNPFIPEDMRTILASRPDPDARIQWNGRYVGVPHKAFNDAYSVTQYILGIRGDVGTRDWTYDAYLSTDRTSSAQTIRNAVVKARVQELWDAPDGGASICAGGYNPFGDGNARQLSQECIDYMAATLRHTQDIEQDIFEVSLQGGLATLPAGDLRFSVAGGWRQQKYEFMPDYQMRELGAIEAITAQAETAGTIRVSEIGGELLIPLIANRALVQSWELGAAYRFSSYNFAGDTNTYKLDTIWTVGPRFMVRGGYARAVRAPAMAEAFYNRQPSPGPIGQPPSGGDPCDIRTTARQVGGESLRQLCIATGVPEALVDTLIVPTTSAGNSITSGNTDLDPERADTYTAGVVINPSRNVTFSIDYFDIEIEKVIGTVNAANTLQRCYNQDGTSNPDLSPTQRYCTLLHRDANGLLFMVDTPYLNLGGLRNRGVDVQFSWNHQIGPGTLSLSTLASHLIEASEKDFEDSPWVDFAGTGSNYDWQTLTSVGYAWNRASVGLRHRYTTAQKHSTAVTRPANPAPGNKAFSAFDLNGSFMVSDNVSIRGGIRNLVQPSPPEANVEYRTTNGGLYDGVGRQFYISVRAGM